MFRLLTDVAHDLRRHPQRFRLLALGALYGLAVATLVFTVLSQVNLTRLAQQSDSQRALIVECTTPPGQRTPPDNHPDDNDCYLRNQAATGAAVAQIGDLSVVAAACGAAHPGNVPATRSCVERSLPTTEGP